MKKIIAAISFAIVIIILLKFFTNTKPSLTTFGYGYKKESMNLASENKSNRFALVDHLGVFQDLNNINDKILVFISHNTKCDYLLKNNFNPYSFFNEYKNLQIFIINSDIRLHRESFSKIKNFSILLDESRSISKKLNFSFVGDFALIDSKNWSLIKKGNLSQSKKSNLFANCKLDIPNYPELSYVNDIAPIITEKCLTCHSVENKILPTFDNFRKIKNWQKMILETLYSDRMPPTSHDNYYDTYKNTDELTPEEKSMLITWLENPKSDIKDIDPLENFQKTRHKKSKQFPEIYSAEMDKPHQIPPGGEIIYKYFQLGGPTPYDMWVKSIKGTSTNPRQLHHESIMFVSKPLTFYDNYAEKNFSIDQRDIEENMDGVKFPYTFKAIETFERKNNKHYFRFNAFGAGKKRDGGFPINAYGFVPKGSYLILETHYMGTGKFETEQTHIKIFGTTKKPNKIFNIRTAFVSSNNFTIPANNSNFEVKTKTWQAKKDISIISFSGHMHMRGKSVKMISIDKNNNIKTLLSLPKYYYGWHTGVPIKPSNPVKIQKGSKLQVICHYDNSINNPFNPDPNKVLHFGQRLDRAEMCKIHFTFLTEN